MRLADVASKRNTDDIDTVAVGGLSTRVQAWLDRERQGGESEAMWVARLLCADIESKRWALENAADPDEKKAAALDLKAVAEARKVQMEIIARASDVEQKKTEDASMADAFRLMASRYPKETAHVTVGPMAMTRREKAAAWKAGTLGRE